MTILRKDRPCYQVVIGWWQNRLW